MPETPVLTVASLLSARPGVADVPLEVLGGASGLTRRITSDHLQEAGLALAGFHQYLRPGQILLFGESEARYVESLDAAALAPALADLFGHDLPCVVVAGGWTPPAEFVAAADARGLPLLRTSLSAMMTLSRLGATLEDALATREVIHGVLMDLLGLGVLIIGESGIGKSECALDLVVRGHRLVADDTVEVRRLGESLLIGTCPALTRYHMEVRGLGLINVLDLFGVASTRMSKQIDVVVQLERWDSARAYDRLGIDEQTYELFGVTMPLIQIAVAPGRSLSVLVEVAARNQLLRWRGRNAAGDLAARLEQQLQDEARDAGSHDRFEDGRHV